MSIQQRLLQDLISIGPATLRDFELLGIRSVKQLARQIRPALPETLPPPRARGVDICCLDTFSAAVAQAAILCFPPSSANGGTGVASEGPRMPQLKSADLLCRTWSS